MADLELRRRVAEARGWTGVEIRGVGDASWVMGFPPGKPVARIAETSEWETDIAAAWELLEGIEYEIDSVLFKKDGMILVLLWDQYGEPHSGQAPTAPAAICKAWLKYKEQHDEAK